MTLRRGTRRCTGAQEGDMQVRGQQGRGIRPPEHREDTGRTQGGHREDGGRTEGGRREDGGRTEGGHREDRNTGRTEAAASRHANATSRPGMGTRPAIS